MINALLLIAAAVPLLAIVRIRAYDAGRKVGQLEGFLAALQMGTAAAEAQDQKDRDWEKFAAGVAPWN